MNSTCSNVVLTLFIAIGTPCIVKAQYSTLLNVPPDLAPTSIGSDTQLNVLSGGFVEVVSETLSLGDPDESSENVELNLFEGGRILTRGFASGVAAHSGSRLNISGGDFDAALNARSGSFVHMSGGVFGGPNPISDRKDFIARTGSNVLLSGGDILSALEAEQGSSITMTGGGLYGLDIKGGAMVTISGGVVAVIDARDNGAFTLQGGEFLRNGLPITELTTIGSSLQLQNPLAEGGTLSGVLADGTPFVFFEPNDGVELNGSTLTLETVAIPANEPGVFTVSDGPVPRGLRSGQSLIVDEDLGVFQIEAGPGSLIDIAPGGNVRRLRAFGATINIEGGLAGNIPFPYFTTIESNVHISDGYVQRPSFLQNSRVSVSGGEIDSLMTLDLLSEATITGGLLHNLSVQGGSTANISGGDLLNLHVGSDGLVVILGGEISRLEAGDNSTVQLIGTEFFLDGEAIPALSLSNQFEVADRNVVLSGTLADGSQFSFPLDLFPPRGGARFANSAALIVTLIPEPATTTLTLAATLCLATRRHRRLQSIALT